MPDGFKITANTASFARFNGNAPAAKIRAAMREAAKDAAYEIETRGAEDIESAGNFGERWTDGLHAKVTPRGESVVITVSHDVPYFGVFEYGATIEAKNAGDPPLLWLPFETNTSGMWPRAFGQPLFRVDSKKGLPILFSWTPGEKDSAEAQYFGKPSVTIPQKFHIRDIVRQVSREVKTYFKDHMK